MKLFTSTPVRLGIAASMAFLAIGTPAIAATITPLTGGDAGEGLDLSTNQTVVYAVDTFSGADPVIQGVTFSHAFGGTNTVYGSAVVRQSAEYSQNPSFNVSNYSATPTTNDSNLASLFTTLEFGRQRWQFDTVINTNYRLTLLTGVGGSGDGGSATGYVGDFAFKDGNASNNDGDYTLVLDNVVVLPNQSFAITYDFTAAASTASFHLVYPDTYGAIYSGAPNEGGAISLGGFAVTTVVPEPGTVGLLAVAGIGVLAAFRRRLTRSA